MKILQILPELNIGGVERGTVDLARQLLSRDQQALVISNGGSLVKELTSSGVRHIQLPVHKKSLFSILANIPKVAKIIREEKVDIVHARSRIPAIIAFFACRGTAAFFVTTCHGYYSQNLASRVMGWGRCVIVSSNIIAQHMLRDFGVPRERIRLIPRGVDLQEFRFNRPSSLVPRPSSIFTIGVVGRLTPLKGHKYFLQALAKVIRVLPQVRALIVGDISPGKDKYKEELQMLSRRLSLDRYVQFLGRVDNMPRVYSQLDALVLPTVTQEAFGRVIIEAGACGVPVIATKVGGVVDIIEDGVNGVLVTPKNPDDLAQAIIRLSRQPELTQRLAVTARRRVEEDYSLKQMARETISVYEQVQTHPKILVIKLGALGDIILAVSSLRALRENFPQAHIAVLVGSPFRPILQNCPYINQTIEFPLASSYRDIWHLSSLLRKLNFDIVIDLQNNRLSHLLSFLSACNRRYGYDNGKFSLLLNRKVREVKSPLSPIKHQGRTLKLLGIESVKEDLELWPDTDDKRWVEDFLKKHRKNKTVPLVGINPGASPRWLSKRWGVAKFAALLDKMQANKMEVLITGKGEDKELLGELRQLCKNSFIDAVDKTSFMQLACLIKSCNAYITSDSAPLHIAYAMKTPVVALFGPTDPRRHTIASARQVVIKKEVACSPCYRRRCRKHSCMQDISVEEVFEAVRKLL